MIKKFFQTKVFSDWSKLYRFAGSRFDKRKRDRLEGRSGELFVIDMAKKIPSKTILQYMSESDDGRDDVAGRVGEKLLISDFVAHIALLLREETELMAIVRRFRKAGAQEGEIIHEITQFTSHLPKTIRALVRGTR